jgi:hypothetical protein
MNEERASNNGVSVDTRGSGSGVSSREFTSTPGQPGILKILGVHDNNKCDNIRAGEINMKLAKFFHHNALPFSLVESDELAELVKALCPAYYRKGMPGRFWMETTGVDLVYNDVLEDVEHHLHSCHALMANMDGWENEKKQQLKIVTVTGKIITR